MLPTLLLFIIVLSEPPHEACCQLKYIYCILCIYSTCTQEEKIFRILEKNLYAVFHNRFLFDTTEQLQFFVVAETVCIFFFINSLLSFHWRLNEIVCVFSLNTVKTFPSIFNLSLRNRKVFDSVQCSCCLCYLLYFAYDHKNKTNSIKYPYCTFATVRTYCEIT